MAWYQIRAHEETKRTDLVGLTMSACGLIELLLHFVLHSTGSMLVFAGLTGGGILVFGMGRFVHGVRSFFHASGRAAIRSKRKAGMETERRVARELDKLREQGYHVLHNLDVHSRRGTAQIDHVLVGHNGVFHIETKGWSGQVTFRAHQVYRDEGKHIENPAVQLHRHDIVMKSLLQTQGFDSMVVHGVLCFGSDNVQVHGTAGEYSTVQRHDLNRTVVRQTPARVLSKRDVNRIYQLIKTHSSESRFIEHKPRLSQRIYNDAGIAFLKMALRPRNWIYPVIGIILSYAIVTVV